MIDGNDNMGNYFSIKNNYTLEIMPNQNKSQHLGKSLAHINNIYTLYDDNQSTEIIEKFTKASSNSNADDLNFTDFSWNELDRLTKLGKTIRYSDPPTIPGKPATVYSRESEKADLETYNKFYKANGNEKWVMENNRQIFYFPPFIKDHYDAANNIIKDQEFFRAAAGITTIGSMIGPQGVAKIIGSIGKVLKLSKKKIGILLISSKNLSKLSRKKKTLLQMVWKDFVSKTNKIITSQLDKIRNKLQVHQKKLSYLGSIVDTSLFIAKTNPIFRLFTQPLFMLIELSRTKSFFKRSIKKKLQASIEAKKELVKDFMKRNKTITKEELAEIKMPGNLVVNKNSEFYYQVDALNEKFKKKYPFAFKDDTHLDNPDFLLDHIDKFSKNDLKSLNYLLNRRYPIRRSKSNKFKNLFYKMLADIDKAKMNFMNKKMEGIFGSAYAGQKTVRENIVWFILMSTLFKVPRAKERAEELSKDRLKKSNKYYQQQLDGIGLFDSNAQIAFDDALTFNLAEKHFQEDMLSYILNSHVPPPKKETFTNISNKTLYEFNLNKTMTYNQAKNHCSEKKLKLASKEDVISSFRYQNKFNGQDIWTPVINSDNEWIQIGNKTHTFSKSHNDLGKPSWGQTNIAKDFRKTFYCVEDDEIETCDDDFDYNYINGVINELNNTTSVEKFTNTSNNIGVEFNIQRYGLDSEDKEGHIFGLTRYGPTVDKEGIFEYPVGIDVVIISTANFSVNYSEELGKQYDTKPEDYVEEPEIYLNGAENANSNYTNIIDDECVWQLYRVEGVTTHDMDYLRDGDISAATEKSMNGMLYAIKNKKTGKYLKNSFDHSSKKSNFLYSSTFIPSTCSWIISRVPGTMDNYTLLSTSQYIAKPNDIGAIVTDLAFLDASAAIFNIVKNKFEAPYNKILHKPYFDSLTKTNDIFMTDSTNIENSWIIADAYSFKEFSSENFVTKYSNYLDDPKNRPEYSKVINYTSTSCNTDDDCENSGFGIGAICQPKHNGGKMCLPGRKYGEFCASAKGWFKDRGGSGKNYSDCGKQNNTQLECKIYADLDGLNVCRYSTKSRANGESCGKDEECREYPNICAGTKEAKRQGNGVCGKRPNGEAVSGAVGCGNTSVSNAHMCQSRWQCGGTCSCRNPSKAPGNKVFDVNAEANCADGEYCDFEKSRLCQPKIDNDKSTGSAQVGCGNNVNASYCKSGWECDSICRKKDGQYSSGLGYCSLTEHCRDGNICCFTDKNGNKRFDVVNNKYYGVCVPSVNVGGLKYCPGDPYIPAARKFLKGDLGGAIASTAEITAQQVEKKVDEVATTAANSNEGQATIQAVGVDTGDGGEASAEADPIIGGLVKVLNPANWR